MWFYLYYTRDLDKAIAYNEKARELFMQIPGYENGRYLTVANVRFWWKLRKLWWCLYGDS
ncbi:MAG: hypothetical protein ACLUIS_09210 [Longibaculum sp.]